MASLVAWTVFDDAGAPRTGLTPTCIDYCDRAGTLRTQPAILELGAGQYGFQPTDADETAGVCYLIDNGVGSNGRRVSGSLSTAAAPFTAWHLEDDTGALWTGAAPTVATYTSLAGPLTSPGVVAVRSYLFAIAPTAPDAATGVTFRAVSPVGANPADITDALQSVSTGQVVPVITPPVTPGGVICDMADAISAMGTGAYVVKRRSTSVYVDGRQTPVVVSTFVISGTLVPLTALEIKRLPDGMRNSELWNLFTSTGLQSSQGNADTVVIDGRDYAVEKVERWSQAGNFVKATLVRPSA